MTTKNDLFFGKKKKNMTVPMNASFFKNQKNPETLNSETLCLFFGNYKDPFFLSFFDFCALFVSSSSWENFSIGCQKTNLSAPTHHRQIVVICVSNNNNNDRERDKQLWPSSFSTTTFFLSPKEQWYDTYSFIVF